MLPVWWLLVDFRVTGMAVGVAVAVKTHKMRSRKQPLQY